MAKRIDVSDLDIYYGNFLAVQGVNISIEDANAALQRSGGQKREADPKVLKMWQDAYVASGPIADEIAKLKREYERPIIAHGGAGFARSLIADGACTA